MKVHQMLRYPAMHLSLRLVPLGLGQLAGRPVPRRAPLAGHGGEAIGVELKLRSENVAVSATQERAQSGSVLLRQSQRLY